MKIKGTIEPVLTKGDRLFVFLSGAQKKPRVAMEKKETVVLEPTFPFSHGHRQRLRDRFLKVLGGS